MTTKTVRYIFEEPVNATTDIAEVQITLGTVNLLQLGEHAKLRRVYQFHSDKLAGKPFSKLTEAEGEALEADIIAFNGLLSRWAGVRTSIRSIKVLLSGESELMEADLGLLGWDTIDGIKTIPVDLFEALDLAAVQVNPRVFGGRYVEDGVDPKERTSGVISVS